MEENPYDPFRPRVALGRTPAGAEVQGGAGQPDDPDQRTDNLGAFGGDDPFQERDSVPATQELADDSQQQDEDQGDPNENDEDSRGQPVRTEQGDVGAAPREGRRPYNGSPEVVSPGEHAQLLKQKATNAKRKCSVFISRINDLKDEWRTRPDWLRTKVAEAGASHRHACEARRRYTEYTGLPAEVGTDNFEQMYGVLCLESDEVLRTIAREKMNNSLPKQTPVNRAPPIDPTEAPRDLLSNLAISSDEDTQSGSRTTISGDSQERDTPLSRYVDNDDGEISTRPSADTATARTLHFEEDLGPAPQKRAEEFHFGAPSAQGVEGVYGFQTSSASQEIQSSQAPVKLPWMSQIVASTQATPAIQAPVVVSTVGARPKEPRVPQPTGGTTTTQTQGGSDMFPHHHSLQHLQPPAGEVVPGDASSFERTTHATTGTLTQAADRLGSSGQAPIGSSLSSGSYLVPPEYLVNARKQCVERVTSVAAYWHLAPHIVTEAMQYVAIHSCIPTNIRDLEIQISEDAVSADPARFGLPVHDRGRSRRDQRNQWGRGRSTGSSNNTTPTLSNAGPSRGSDRGRNSTRGRGSRQGRNQSQPPPMRRQDTNDRRNAASEIRQVLTTQREQNALRTGATTNVVARGNSNLRDRNAQITQAQQANPHVAQTRTRAIAPAQPPVPPFAPTPIGLPSVAVPPPMHQAPVVLPTVPQPGGNLQMQYYPPPGVQAGYPQADFHTPPPHVPAVAGQPSVPRGQVPQAQGPEPPSRSQPMGSTGDYFGNHSHDLPRELDPALSGRHFNPYERREKPWIRVNTVMFDGTDKTVTFDEFLHTFNILCNSKNMPEGEKLICLKQCLAGDALKVFKNICGRKLREGSLQLILQALEDHFGGPQREFKFLIDKLTNMTPLTAFTYENLIDLITLVEDIYQQTSAEGQGGPATDGAFTSHIRRLMPEKERSLYYDKLNEHNRRDTLLTLREFLKKRYQNLRMTAIDAAAKQHGRSHLSVEAETQPMFWEDVAPADEQAYAGYEPQKPAYRPPAAKPATPPAPVDGAAAPAKREHFCSYCQKPHFVWLCPEYKALGKHARFEHVKAKRLCMHCLCAGHLIKHCRFMPDKVCGVNDCQMKHHPLLHIEKERNHITIEDFLMEPDDEAFADQSMFYQAMAASTPMALPLDEEYISIRLVTCDLKYGNKKRRIVVALDSCANNSNIDSELAKELGLPILRGKIQRVMHFLKGKVTLTSDYVQFALCPLGSNKEYPVRAFTVERCMQDTNVVDWNTAADGYPYLREADIPLRLPTDKCQILLGSEYAELMAPHKVLRGEPGKGHPIAELTDLGWAFTGRTNVRKSINQANAIHETIVFAGVDDPLGLDREYNPVPGSLTLPISLAAVEFNVAKDALTFHAKDKGPVDPRTIQDPTGQVEIEGHSSYEYESSEEESPKGLLAGGFRRARKVVLKIRGSDHQKPKTGPHSPDYSSADVQQLVHMYENNQWVAKRRPEEELGTVMEAKAPMDASPIHSPAFTPDYSPIKSTDPDEDLMTYLAMQSTADLQCSVFFTDDGRDELAEIVQKFWDLEAVGLVEKAPRFSNTLRKSDRQWTQAEIDLDARMNIQYIKDMGRFQMSIPWKDKRPSFTSNRFAVAKRQSNTEKGLGPRIENVREIFQGYLEKGYVRKLEYWEQQETDCRYLPYFCVVNENHDTTPVRIVWDCKARFDGRSLNTEIELTPNRLQDLFTVLLRLRKYKYTLTADVSEMFLNVLLDPADRRYHRFVFNDEDYEWNRLVFGALSSPNGSQAVLDKTCASFGANLLEATETLMEACYMDDATDSRPCPERTVTLAFQLIELLGKAGMKVHKFYTNCVELVNQLDPSLLAKQITIEDKEVCYDTGKVLGMRYSADEGDTLSYSGKFQSLVEWARANDAAAVKHGLWTKRHLARLGASIFDPHGLVSPFTVVAKMIMQKVWEHKHIGWDSFIPLEVCDSWEKWLEQMFVIPQIQIRRWSQLEPGNTYQIHTFCDASESAMCCAVYIRVKKREVIEVSLLAAKSRVSPLKAESISRLELCACVLGTRLCAAVKEVYPAPQDDTFFWTDSSVCLHWINTPAKSFKAYVAHRIGEIQNATEPRQWLHVPGVQNPADVGTRGITAHDLKAEKIWWDGPEFLKKPIKEWPKSDLIERIDSVEIKNNIFMTGFALREASFTDALESYHPDRYSVGRLYNGLDKLVRRWAYVLRVIRTLKGGIRSTESRLHGLEITAAFTFLVRQSQYQAFRQEVVILAKEHERQHPRSLGSLPDCSKSILRPFNPSFDRNGVLRSNSRLVNAEFYSYESKHPIILDAKQPLTRLIAEEAHHRLQHPVGKNAVRAELQKRFAIVGLGRLLHTLTHRCMLCQFAFGKPFAQQMAPLPERRLGKELRPFTDIGMDYAGPFELKDARGRPRKKIYVLVITCMAIRAVHFEPTSGMETSDVINALSRFSDIRGIPNTITTDNQTSFVKADKDLREWVRSLDMDEVHQAVASWQRPTQVTKWYYSPPHGPHFGGVFEIMVKAMKRALYATIGSAGFREEEFRTAISKAAAMINNRPIQEVGDDHDFEALTPNHFLNGGCGDALLPPDLQEVRQYVRARWKHQVYVQQHFWKRFQTEVLQAMSPRKKWTEAQPDIRLGELVVEFDDSTPRGLWKKLRVAELIPSDDGLVRRVRVVSAQGKSYERPIHRLIPVLLE